MNDLLQEEIEELEEQIKHFDSDFADEPPPSVFGSLFDAKELKQARRGAYIWARNNLRNQLEFILRKAKEDWQLTGQRAFEVPRINDHLSIAELYGLFESTVMTPNPISDPLDPHWQMVLPKDVDHLNNPRLKDHAGPLLDCFKELQGLTWYLRLLAFEPIDELRKQRLAEHLEACQSWPKEPLLHEIELCKRALEKIKKHPIRLSIKGLSGKVLCPGLPLREEILFLEKTLAGLQALHKRASDFVSPATLAPVELPADLKTYRLLPSVDDPPSLGETLKALSKFEEEVVFALVGDGTASRIYLTLSAPPPLIPKIELQLQSYHHSLVLEELGEGELPDRFRAGASYILTPIFNHPIAPLLTFSNFNNTDPYATLLTNLERLSKGERAAMRVSFITVPHVPPRIQAIFGSLVDNKAKNQSSMWAVRVQLLADAQSESKACEIVKTLEVALQQYVALPSKIVPWIQTQERALLERFGCTRPQLQERIEIEHRVCIDYPPTTWPLLYLNTDELSSLVHLPHKTAQSTWLMRPNSKDRSIPEFLTTAKGLYLGTAEYRREQHQIRLPQDRRTRHAYIIGASGVGKSNFMKNCIRQDMEEGRGLCVIDPHSDLVTDVLPFVPKQRIEDVIIFDPSDRAFPVSINPLGLETTDDDRNSVALTFQTAFMRMFSVGEEAPRMLHLLHMVTSALLESGGKTFLDIRRFLISSEFREEVLGQVNDPTLLEFWYEEYPRDYPKAAAAPINTRLTQFSMSPITRNILGQKTQAFNLFEIMNSGKILLCPLGKIEEQERQLLGSLIVSQIQLATMRRAELPEAQRRPFITYVDEFQNFTNDVRSLEKLLSEARKYGVGLVLAHQFITQLGSKLADAVMTNTHTKAVFRVSSEDARYLAKDLAGFEAEDLQSQQQGQAVLCVEKAENSFTIRTDKFPSSPERNHAQAVIEHSQKTYGRPRAEVEAELRPKKPAKSGGQEQAEAVNEGEDPAPTKKAKGSRFDDLMGEP